MDKPHMTPDQIKEAAIEAATRENFDAYRREFGGPKWDELPVTAHRGWLATSKRIIRAYEAAMWRPIEEAPLGVSILVSGNAYGQPIVEQNVRSEGYGDFETVLSLSVEKPTHFRPLPQPPEVKHEPA